MTGAAKTVLVSLMCHPERSPKIAVPSGEGYEVMLNRTPNYAAAYRFAIENALSRGADLVTADTDGYHPVREVVKLATGDFGEGPALVLPYRLNLGFQSKSYSLLFSLLRRRRIRDATGGLVRISNELLRELPRLKSPDMTIHIEILNLSMRKGARIVQYGYLSDANDEAESRRTRRYQLKLLKAALS